MSIRHYIEKILLMSWRLHKIQWNRPAELVWMIFMPIILCCIGIGMNIGNNEEESLDIKFDPINLDQNWADLIEMLGIRERTAKAKNGTNSVFIPQLIIGWAPHDYNIFLKIMEGALKRLPSVTPSEFEDCEELQEAMEEEYFLAGICFDQQQYERDYVFVGDFLAPDEKILTQFNYSIMFPSELRNFDYTYIGDNWNTLYHDDPKLSLTKRMNDGSNTGHLNYVREGFIQIQRAISETYLTLVSRREIPNIVVRRFPVHNRKRDPKRVRTFRSLPLLIVFGFMFPAQLLVSQVVEDKEHQMRRFLINMNMGNIIHFLSWYSKSLTYMVISSIVIMMLLKVPWKGDQSVFTHTPWYIILLVFISYNFAVISFSLMVASFFKNANLALRVMTTLWMITYLPFFVIINNREKVGTVFTYIASSFPNTLMATILNSMMERELFSEKKWTDRSYGLNYSSKRIFVYQGSLIFLVTTIVHAALGLYMDIWHMGESGGKRRKQTPSNTQSGDFSYSRRDDSVNPQGSQPVGVKTTKIYEVEPSHRRFKIKIKKLCKRYANDSRGVLNSFSWNVYENEVTILMGHNGCGKTTLLKILAGLVEPTRGIVMIADYNIQTERHESSLQLGIALNNNLLCPDLTVSDQLRFMCVVKGMSWKAASYEIDTYIQQLELTHVKHTKIKNVTAGERVLINVGCAFIGGSPIVLIDDIHSDLDVTAQNLICNLINGEKSKRTILLVTNSTSLAGHLADRLAIMSNGEIKCTGSKPFLRNMYGYGFRLTCVKDTNFDMNGLQNLMNRYIPNPTVESDIGNKVTFVLETKYEDKFTDMLDDLEDELNNLGIISFRIRDTSLDEIFFRFGSEDTDMTEDSNILIDDLKLILEESDAAGRKKGHRLVWMRIQALLYMRLILNKRQVPIKVINAIALMIGTICAFSSVLFYGKDYELIPISFNLTQLGRIEAFVEVMAETFDVTEMQQFYVELLFWYDGHVMKLKTADTSDFYLLQTNDYSENVNFHYLFGASFGVETITSWFNNIPLHGATFGLNLVHNVVARRFFDQEASIDVSLHPLPFQTKVNSMPHAPISLGVMICISYTFVFSNLWLSTTIASVLEHNYKKQQFFAGVRLYIFCICTGIYDVLRVILVTGFIICLITFFLTPRHDLHFYAWLFSAFTLNGLGVVSFWFLVSALNLSLKTSFLTVCTINTLGLAIFSISVVNRLVDMEDLFQILPQYTFCEIVVKLFYIYQYNWLCSDPSINFLSTEVENCHTTPNCCRHYDYWKGNFSVFFDGTIMILSIVVPLLIFVVREYYSDAFIRIFPKCVVTKKNKKSKKKKKNQAMVQDESSVNDLSENLVDESVIAERERIENMAIPDYKNYAAVCRSVTKAYQNKKIIRRLDLCIEQSECISMMGVNNAGKTTILKLLVGDAIPNSGQIWIGGHNMISERFHCYPFLGYCSQSVNLPQNLTPYELLLIQAKLHGLQAKFGTPVCDGLAQLLGFRNCYRFPVSVCTIAELRRISFALAILADPKLICVDGPPAGIDPAGKRIIYKLTDYMQKRGSSFIYANLTSLESERICQRMVILQNGKVLTLNKYRNCYRRGYQLQVRFKRKANADVTTVRATWDRINQFPVSPHNKLILFIQIKFPEAVLLQQYETSMAFYVPYNSISFSELFTIIRKDAFELNIEEFFITRNVIGKAGMVSFDSSAFWDR